MYAFNALTGQLKWATTIGFAGPFLEVTLSGATVYADTFRNPSSVYAFDAANGRILWSAQPPSCCVTGPVSVAGGLAYVVTDHLVAYSAATGVRVFTSAKGPFDYAALSHGVAYVPSSFALQAFNASNGALLWSAPTDTDASCLRSPTMAVDGGTVVVGTGCHLIAFVANTGARRWATGMGCSTTCYTAEAIANGVVYSATTGNGLQAMDEATGKLRFSGGFDCISAIVSRGAVYVPCVYGMAVFGL